MSSDQLFNILLSLLFIGIAFSLTYYQPWLNTAPRTQITCFLISFLLSNWSISRTLVNLWEMRGMLSSVLIYHFLPAKLLLGFNSCLRPRLSSGTSRRWIVLFTGCPWKFRWLASITLHLCSKGGLKVLLRVVFGKLAVTICKYAWMERLG